jgi:hypothetical protein
MRSIEFVLFEGFPMVSWFFLLCNLLRTTRNAFRHLSAMFFKVSSVIWGIMYLSSLKSLLYWLGFSHVSVPKGPWAKPHKALTTSFCNTRTSEVTGVPVFVSWEMRLELLSCDCSLSCIMIELCLPGVFYLTIHVLYAIYLVSVLFIQDKIHKSNKWVVIFSLSSILVDDVCVKGKHYSFLCFFNGSFTKGYINLTQKRSIMKLEFFFSSWFSHPDTYFSWCPSVRFKYQSFRLLRLLSHKLLWTSVLG